MDISVVIPVYNEEGNLEELFKRLCESMDAIGRKWEVIFTNDGSKDRSGEILRRFYSERPDIVRVIDFNGNFGQHTAIIAAFEKCKGDVIVTLDADLQNPPEEIRKLIEKTDQGYDAVGGFRKVREDSAFRKYASKCVNFVREKMTDIRMKDQGCMLRAYKRHIVDAILRCDERSTFIPALAYKFASNPIDVEVDHAARKCGESKYSIYKLIRLNFDLITGFTIMPIQLFTLFGFASASGSFLLVIILLARRFLLGSEAEGLFTLFAILFFLISIAIIGIGILGEYVGRIYQVVQARPKYIIRDYLCADNTPATPEK
ncbi:MAG: glycosyltransferase [Opitutales bacterium]|nr:glycosyltransferase [Opitutales bacterium]